MTLLEERARTVFLAVLERATEQWPAFLTEACAGNALRARVDHVLHAHQALGSIRAGGAEPPGAGGAEPAGQRLGTPRETIDPAKALIPEGSASSIGHDC